MHSLPLFLRIRGQTVLVVGEGRLASLRMELLVQAGARVRLIAAQPEPVLADRIATLDIEHHRRGLQEQDISGCALALALSDDAQANAQVVRLARSRGIWVQCAGQDDESDFMLPAVVDRSPLLIALSSGGAAPALTRLLRARLESLVPSGYQRLAAMVGAFRARAAMGRSRGQRRRFWDAVLDGPIAEKVLAGRDHAARADLQQLLDSGQHCDVPTGEVYLVGAGPGAPDLLTFRALRLMQRADVVLYDSLVASAIVDMVRPEAERIHVGKRASRHTLAQEDINDLMVRLATQGKRILRLKGGDPFIFGRGGEEIAKLADAGIAFQVVPGITAANGCAAYAGIPLTHRDYAQSVQFITGHRQQGELVLDWQRLVAPGQTLVFFMGRGSLPDICSRLFEYGLSETHPAALVEEGTTERQRVLVGDISNLPERVAAAEVTGPSLLIVGEVVRLNEKLGWFAPAKARD